MKTTALFAALAWAALLSGASQAQPPSGSPSATAQPLRRRPIEPPPRDVVHTEVRQMDGTNNNLDDREMGAADTGLSRMAGVDYDDAVSSLASNGRPSPREISNVLFNQTESIPDRRRASDYLWQWGQFLDHDIDLTGAADPAEPADVAVPIGDPFFDPDATGTALIFFDRSSYDLATGTDAGNPRQQTNAVTAWIDASQVYGSDGERAVALRENDGSGRLRTSAGNLLPFNTDGLPNAGGTSSSLFLAGDVRANEQVGLTAMHTLFVREHNRWAAALRRQHPDWGDELIYQRARQLVGAELQAITYQEFLPQLLGRGAIPPYRGYDETVDARIMNEFSTAAYRFGHSALSPVLLRLDRRGREIEAGNLRLRDAFFAPQRLTDEGGIEPILRGLAAQVCQRIDARVVDDVRNFLFGEPGQGGFDLASLNIQRGRDHGLASYNDARAALGLPPAERFADVSSDPGVQRALESLYGSPDAIDLWVGGLAEDPVRGSMVGELFQRVLVRQFTALRDGDRFWYRRTLSPEAVKMIESIRLADVIRWNTAIGDELPNHVFRVPRHAAARRR